MAGAGGRRGSGGALESVDSRACVSFRGGASVYTPPHTHTHTHHTHTYTTSLLGAAWTPPPHTHTRTTSLSLRQHSHLSKRGKGMEGLMHGRRVCTLGVVFGHDPGSRKARWRHSSGGGLFVLTTHTHMSRVPGYPPPPPVKRVGWEGGGSSGVASILRGRARSTIA
jgi:hypothetical protein